jgi:hypothetical protein
MSVGVLHHPMLKMVKLMMDMSWHVEQALWDVSLGAGIEGFSSASNAFLILEDSGDLFQ